MFNRLLRYHDIIRLAKVNGAVSILEVGSGALGIGEYFPGKFVGCDVAFDGRPVSNMQAVKASSLTLPFRDGAFDVVISSDMLEHLATEERPVALAEIARVTGRVAVVGCPVGSRALNCDKRLAHFLARRKVAQPVWLLEHLEKGFPSTESITSVLDQLNQLYTVHRNESAPWHLLVMLLEATRAGRYLAVIDRHFRFLAPAYLHTTRRLGSTYRVIFVIKKQDRQRTSVYSQSFRNQECTDCLMS